MGNNENFINYKTVIKKYEILNVIKKSKFYSFIVPCNSVEEFQLQLDLIKGEFGGANHYCYAYRINEQILRERYQDDKEPSGTAGIPILDVLKGRELEQCGIIVVRYFGGTKLGTGGLSRAYSQGAIDVIDKANIISKESALILHIEVDYTLTGKLEYFISANLVPLLETIYESTVKYIVVVQAVESDELITAINELTNGQNSIIINNKAIGYFCKNQFIIG